MKDIQEKVKDIVDVGLFRRLIDFTADPARTLGRYHFTDVTSDLMGKWLDRIANYQGQHSAYALAGYRGVGKSHFLAALGAILSHPELRSRVTDSHVLASAQRLRRRSYLVANVRRGMRETLHEELQDAIAESLGLEPYSVGDTVTEMLDLASHKAGDVPFILIVDTALERDSRVSRDDGAFLSEIAEIADEKNIFLGIALDDDIADADGINSSIARSFAIDYLDQEHLYKIVDAYVFPKQNQKQAVLHDIYDYFRSVLTGFRWSEQKFTALYPMHPIILEVAPFVRFYVHDFALLGFAEESGVRVLPRPAKSLIGLDEVFDSVEKQLREVDDLHEAFTAYDLINEGVVGKLPVMKRLNAKLVLKGLFLLSLDGNGKTAEDVRSAMLIVDEKDPQRSSRYVEELLESFVAQVPEDLQRVQEENREARYSFKLRIKDDLNLALAAAIEDIPREMVPRMLRRAMRERFSDCTLTDDDGPEAADWMDCQISWRGGLRRGRMFWESPGSKRSDASATNTELIDWEVAVLLHDSISSPEPADIDIPRAVWKQDTLRPDEIDTVLRFHVLSSNAELRDQFSSQVRSSMHAHKIETEKIFQRSFLTDGKLAIDGVENAFTDEARSSERLSDLLSIMLKPLFEARYPDHPTFPQTLSITEVSLLATDLFSGSGQNSPEVQQLAENFALPLGVVTKRGELFVPQSEEKLTELPVAKEILGLLDAEADGFVSIKTIYKHLKKSAHGLVREAQQLILTALVSRQQIEFITIKGDRINRRSLDLKIIWGDIEGVARPAGRKYSAEKLTHWVSTLTGDSSNEGIEDHETIRKSLSQWLKQWRERRTLERFNELPDENLNTRIWRLSMHAKNSFGAVADTIEAVMENSMTMDEAIHRIADAFSDSKEEFLRRTKDLETIENFISGAARREEIRTYLAVSETTKDEKIESLREELAQIIDASYYDPSELYNREMESLWETFRTQFAEKFAASHDAVMRSHYLQEKFDDIQRSDRWWEFENLSSLPVVEARYWKNAKTIFREFRQLDCRFNIREMLKIHPFCACSFSLDQTEHWESLPQTLSDTIENGLESYYRTLKALSSSILPKLRELPASAQDAETATAVSDLEQMIEGRREFAAFSTRQMQVLRKIFESTTESEFVMHVSPESVSVMHELENDHVLQ